MGDIYLDEIVKLLGANRKETTFLLGVSTPQLSHWATGKDLISEPHLATLVNALPLDMESKQREFLRVSLLLWQEKLRRDSGPDRDKSRWNPDTIALANLSFERAIATLSDRRQVVKTEGYTLRDFPRSFSPLAIISGDKREDSGSRITWADVGAVSPSHAEFRWLPSLGLDRSVEIYSDKMFVLETADELKKRFGEKHLLVLGSPASNHLARRCLLARQDRIKGWQPAAPIFRFNLPKFVLKNIEAFISSVEGKKAKELAARQEDPSTSNNMKTWLHYLFTGGILDPTHSNHWLRGFELPPHRDYGLVTLARNPFSDPSGKPYLCIMVAGFHLFGTAHALKMLSTAEKSFERHPYGGVIEIDIASGLPFASRFDESTAAWDDPDGYEPRQVRDGLIRMKTNLYPTLHVTSEEIDECLAFLDLLVAP
jgi:hypothetical protein